MQNSNIQQWAFRGGCGYDLNVISEITKFNFVFNYTKKVSISSVLGAFALQL